MFRGCPCVRACIQAWGRRHYPTGLPLTASFFPVFVAIFPRCCITQRAVRISCRQRAQNIFITQLGVTGLAYIA